MLIAWVRPIESASWNLTTDVRRLLRVHRLFGHNAVSTYMAPSNDSTFPGGIRWTLVTGGSAFYDLPDRSELYLDGRFDDLKAGAWILISAPASTGGPANTLVVVTSVTADSDTLGASTDTVTRITTFPPVPLAGADRRRVHLYEVLGPSIRFSGDGYARSLTHGPLLAPGRRVDGTHIEINRRISAGAIQPGPVIDIDRIETGRYAVLTDLQHPSVAMTIQSRVIVDDEMTIGPTPDDLTTAAALGLDSDHAEEFHVSRRCPPTRVPNHPRGERDRRHDWRGRIRS